MVENNSGLTPILWHQLSPQLALEQLKTDPAGLNAEGVQRRQLHYASNELESISGEMPGPSLSPSLIYL